MIPYKTKSMMKHLLFAMAIILTFGMMTTPVTVFADSAVTEQDTETKTIAAIRDLPDETTVTTSGIVTADAKSISNGKQLSTYIQDETGGINIFAYDRSDFPDLKKGDKVTTTGSLKTYKGLKELVPTEIEVISSNEALPEPKEITLEDLQSEETAKKYEGQLVKVKGNARQVPSSAAGGGYNVSFVDEAYNGTTLRVMENALDISKIEEGKWYEVTAIVGRYDSYQLIPTEASDIKLSETQPELPSPAGTYTAKVGSVTDGDTIELEHPVIGTTRVRLLNMDSAETYPPNNTDYRRKEINDNQKQHGDAATDYIQELISVGDEVDLEVGEEATDAYGRLLAEVVRKDGMNINLEMVKKGHATTYFIAPIDEAAYPKYQAAVKEAKDQGLGIWNPDNPLIEQPFEWRVKDDGKSFNKYIGNSDTKELVEPDDWETVPVEKRIFFWNKEEGLDAGYTLTDGNDGTDPEEPENPDTGDESEKTITPTQQYGPAKIKTEELNDLTKGSTLTIDLKNNKQNALLLMYDQVKLLKEKEVTLIVKSDEHEQTYDMKEQRNGTMHVRLSKYGQHNGNQNGQGGNQHNGGQNQNGQGGNQQNGGQHNNNQGQQNHKGQDDQNGHKYDGKQQQSAA